MHRPAQTLTLLLVAAVMTLSACSGPSAAEIAFDEGRYEDAHAAYVATCEEAGDDASPALLYNRALAAFRAGAWDDADAAAEKAAEDGSPEVVRLAGFLRGNVAFSRAGLAERQARTVEAEPFAFDVALAYARTARARFQVAAMSVEDWPAARRNVERSLLLVADLERLKAEAEKARETKKTSAESTPIVVRDPDQPPDEIDPEDLPGASLKELSASRLAALFDTLARKDEEKARVRRERQAERGSQVERDW